MNSKDWAEKLNGREYGNELSIDEIKQLVNDNKVVVYGSSDDLLELEGAISNEYSVYNEKTFFYCGKETFADQDEINELLDYVDDEYPSLSDIVTDALCRNDGDDLYITIRPGSDCQFEFETNIPNVEWFDIVEDGNLYCKGFVFDKSDLEIDDDFDDEMFDDDFDEDEDEEDDE